MGSHRLAAVRQRDFEFVRKDGNTPGLNQAAADRRFLLRELDKALRELAACRVDLINVTANAKENAHG
jgi:hypothetical protein